MKPTVKPPQIKTSSNYDQFTYNEEQRPIKPAHVKALMHSMARFGFIPSKPIQCYAKGSKFVIVDGHHRFIAAKNNQIPLVFIVEESGISQESMAVENSVVARWRLIDFVNIYARRGMADYIELKTYSDLGIQVMMAANLMAGNGAVSNVQSSHIKNLQEGKFKIETRKRILPIVEIINDFKAKNTAFGTANFIMAIELCMRVDEFDIDRLRKKIALNIQAIGKTATVNQMLDSIEECYNHHASSKIPLAFLANQKKKNAPTAAAK